MSLLLLLGDARTGYDAEVHADSPLAHYRMGEPSGTTLIDDEHAHDGTYQGTPALAQTGITGGGGDTAVTFDGTTAEYGLVAGWTTIPNKPITVEAWAKLVGTPANAGDSNLAGWFSAAGVLACQLYVAGAGAGVTTNVRIGTETGNANFDCDLSDGGWHHFVGTIDSGGNARFYFDGALVSGPNATSFAGGASLNAFRIGTYPPGIRGWPGGIDEVAVYGSALSLTRIQAHYTAGTTSAGTNAAAGTAAGSGAASNATASVKPNAGTVNGSGGASGVTAHVKPTAGVATASGAAANAGISTIDSADAGTATGTGAAANASTSVKASAGVATATGTALNATPAFARLADAGTATGSGTGLAAAASIKPNAGVATGSGAAANVTASTTDEAPAETATGSGAAAGVSASIQVNAATATATGAAENATTATARLAAAGVAEGSGAALGASASIGANAGIASGTGAASDVAASTTDEAPAGTGTGSGTGHGTSTAITASVTAATSSGAAHDATAATAAGTNAAAGTASGTGAAESGSAAVAPHPNEAHGGTGYEDIILGDSPLAYYRLGEAFGSTLVDETGNHDGVYVGSPTLGQTGAVSGDTSVLFDGTNAEYGTVAAWTTVPNKPITLETWAKQVGTVTTETSLGGWFHQSGVMACQLYVIPGGGVTTNVRIGTEQGNANADLDLSDGGWHHIVGTIDVGGSARLYFDGALVSGPAGVTFAGGLSDNPFKIGTFGADGTKASWPGAIDEFAVYDTALSGAQVLTHYRAGSVFASAAVAPVAGTATATGQASNVGASTTDEAPADTAIGTGAAHGIAASVAGSQGTGTGTGQATDPGPSVAPTAHLAGGTGAGLDATVTTTAAGQANADVATGNGTAQNAGVGGVTLVESRPRGRTVRPIKARILRETVVIAGTARGYGTAYDARPELRVIAGGAAGKGKAFDPATRHMDNLRQRQLAEDEALLVA